MSDHAKIGAGTFFDGCRALFQILHFSRERPIALTQLIVLELLFGDVAAADFASRRRDEIGALAMALSRMRRSLEQAMRMLDA